eukprot:CAMPEP_0113851928 /NCGR_PEP_ID=MMETSP0372-20130328/5051_1 /TAXON_ID=340204 /ORGANISM="Lankesteria abbotti" /LENGTH=86 /DNA_ID=CAMNT_0000823069 /DNA_START=8 /DNA_END=265 /DNA_ORIENTATION=- /assembly_acc=CAM_ASM_000359
MTSRQSKSTHMRESEDDPCKRVLAQFAEFSKFRQSADLDRFLGMKDVQFLLLYGDPFEHIDVDRVGKPRRPSCDVKFQSVKAASMI